MEADEVAVLPEHYTVVLEPVLGERAMLGRVLRRERGTHRHRSVDHRALEGIVPDTRRTTLCGEQSILFAHDRRGVQGADPRPTRTSCVCWSEEDRTHAAIPAADEDERVPEGEPGKVSRR